MLKEIRPALIVLLMLTAITGLAYPLAITGLAQLAFPVQASGSLIERDGQVIGSELIGQQFASDRYFHGRPSATTAPDPKDASKSVPSPYNAANSGGSNLGPTSKNLAERVKADVAKLKAEVDRLGGPANMTPDDLPEAHIRGDVNVPYQCIGGAIYTMQMAGFSKVGFISQPPAAGGPA